MEVKEMEERERDESSKICAIQHYDVHNNIIIIFR